MPQEEVPASNQPAPSPVPATASETPAGYESNPFNLIKPSWEGIKLNGMTYVLLILLTLGIVLAAAIVLGILGFVTHPVALTVTLTVVAVLVYAYFAITKLGPATYRLQLAMARRQKMSLREAMNVPAATGWHILWTAILAGLATLGGLILFIVPGIIFGIWFSLSVYVVIEENLTGVAALRRSRQLVKNRFWDTLGVMSLLQATGLFYLIPVIGWLLVVVASFILMPAVAIRYDQLVKLKASHDGTGMATSPANYAALVLAIISLVVSGQYSAKNRQMTPQTYNLPVEKSDQPY